MVTQSQGNHPPQSTTKVLFLSIFISILQKFSITSCHKSTVWFALTSFLYKKGTHDEIQTAILIIHYLAFRHQHKNLSIRQVIQCNRIGIQHAYELTSTSECLIRLQLTSTGILCPERTHFLHDASNIFTNLFVIFSLCYSEYTVSLTSSSGENKQYHMVCAYSEFQIKKHEYLHFTKYRKRVIRQKYCINIFAFGLLPSPIKQNLVLILSWQSLSL